MKLKLLAALILLATGALFQNCDRGSAVLGPLIHRASQKVAAPPARRTKIDAFGDSTIWGTALVNGTYVQSPDNEPTSLARALESQYDLRVDVRNKGMGGSTAADWLYGQTDVRHSWIEHMRDSDAEIVLINPAINDAARQNVTEDEFRFYYGEFVRIARSFGKILVIASPNPVDTPHNAQLARFAQIQRKVAAEAGVPFVDQFEIITREKPGWQKLVPDGIHPAAELYVFKAENTARVLAPIVRSLEAQRSAM